MDARPIAWKWKDRAEAQTGAPEWIWDVPGVEAYHGRNIHLTEALTLEAVRELEESVRDGQPFHPYLSHDAVHAPWEKHVRFYALYLEAGLSPFEATLVSMIETIDLTGPRPRRPAGVWKRWSQTVAFTARAAAAHPASKGREWGVVGHLTL